MYVSPISMCSGVARGALYDGSCLLNGLKFFLAFCVALSKFLAKTCRTPAYLLGSKGYNKKFGTKIKTAVSQKYINLAETVSTW